MRVVGPDMLNAPRHWCDMSKIGAATQHTPNPNSSLLIANPCCGVQAMERRRRQVEPRKKLGQAQAPITGGEGFVNIQCA